MFALRKVAEERIGELTDALLDPNHSVQVRSRIARVLAIGVSQRAVDALLLGLDDGCFEVRFQAARSLAAVVNRNSLVRVDRDRICEVVSREVTVGDPAGQNLGHIFTLLSLVLPREPLQIAFRSLQSDDRQLRGTALEYLEQILPVEIRVSLWPSLAVRRRPAADLQPA
jgi:HEAT repeat protein